MITFYTFTAESMMKEFWKSVNSWQSYGQE